MLASAVSDPNSLTEGGYDMAWGKCQKCGDDVKDSLEARNLKLAGGMPVRLCMAHEQEWDRVFHAQAEMIERAVEISARQRVALDRGDEERFVALSKEALAIDIEVRAVCETWFASESSR